MMEAYETKQIYTRNGKATIPDEDGWFLSSTHPAASGEVLFICIRWINEV